MVMVQMLEFWELPLPLVQLPLLSSKTKENPDNKRSKDVPRKSRNQSEVMPDSITRVIDYKLQFDLKNTLECKGDNSWNIGELLRKSYVVDFKMIYIDGPPWS
jgi:hypothetical protein